MKAKSKIILTSVATIALSAGLAVGGTFALFTSEDQVNIAVNAGKVKVEAEIKNLKLYSAKAATASDAGAFQDEDDAWYVHEYQGDNVTNFSMGGSASLVGGTLTLTNAIPGDKVEFDITIDNTSNVGILYRTVVTCEEGQFLYNALDFGSGVDYSGYKYYKTEWTSIDPNGAIATVPFSIALPVNLNNDYQEQGCKINFKVEAVQGNASVVTGPEYEAMVFSNGVELEKNDDAENSYKLESAFTSETLASEKVSVGVPAGAELTWVTGAGHGSTPFVDDSNTTVEDVVIEGAGKGASTFTATGSGVGAIGVANGATTTFRNITIVDKSESYNENHADFATLEFKGDLVFENVEFANPISVSGNAKFVNCSFVAELNASGSDYLYSVYVRNGSASFDSCTFTGMRGIKVWSAYSGDYISSVSVVNSFFTDIGKKPGLAIDVARQSDFALVIKGCTFTECQGGEALNADGTTNPEKGVPYVYETDSDLRAYAGYDVSKNEVINGLVKIGTKEELIAFANDVNVNGNGYSGKYIKLTADIDLENMSWTPIGQTGGYSAQTWFQGTFDGDGHTISNLNVSVWEAGANEGKNFASGLFGFVDAGDAKIINLTVDGATVTGHHWAGVIAGYLTGQITNCTVKNATVICTHKNGEACGDKAGVIVGYVNSGIVTGNTAVDCTVTGGRDAGQIAGAAKTTQVYGNTATRVSVSATGDCTGANINNAEIGRVM